MSSTLGGAAWPSCINDLHSDFCATEVQANPWLSIQISGQQAVRLVWIMNRGDCCGDRLSPFQIWVGASSGDYNSSTSQACVVGNQMVPATAGPFSFGCVRDLTGTYVTIVLPGTNRILNLAEVRIFSSPSPGAYFSGQNEVVSTFEPPEPPSPSRTGCPHDQSGLVSWHNAATWASGVPPSAGAHVTLPQGQKVLLSRDVGYTLGLVTIPATSELIIGENSTHGVALNMAGMQVDGALRAGAQTCRLTTRVTITLFGARPPTKAERDALPPTFKGIVVSSTGSLDLHGQRFYSTWTRLAAPGFPGDTTVYLQRAVNWEPGQQVLLTTTALKDARDYHRNEVFLLSSLRSSSPRQRSLRTARTALGRARWRCSRAAWRCRGPPPTRSPPTRRRLHARPPAGPSARTRCRARTHS